MKVAFNTNESAVQYLKRRIFQDGDEVVKDFSEAAVSIVDFPTDVNVCEYVWDGKISATIAEALGFKVADSRDTRPDFTFTGFWKHGWTGQTLLGIPIYGTMRGGVGARVPTAFAARYVDSNVLFQSLAGKSNFEQGLRTIHYCGPVSLCCAFTEDGFEVTSVRYGIPFNGTFNLIEGIYGTVSEFLRGDLSFKESWTVNLVVSRFPWPAKTPKGKTKVSKLKNVILKHFWNSLDIDENDSAETSNLVIGIASSWSPLLYEACARVVRTAENIEVEEKQFRDDLKVSVVPVFSRLHTFGLIA